MIVQVSCVLSMGGSGSPPAGAHISPECLDQPDSCAGSVLLPARLGLEASGGGQAGWSKGRLVGAMKCSLFCRFWGT